MLWNDLIDLASDGVVEDISDDSNDFFRKTKLKLWAAAMQTQAACSICCLESSVNITLSAGVAMCALPNDFIKAQGVKFGTQYFLKETWKRPNIATTNTASPCYFWIEGDNIGFYPTPDAAGTVTLYYWRKPPQYAMVAINDDHTSATVAVGLVNGAAAISFVTVGGTAAGTTTFAFNTYPTMGEMKDAIIAANIGVTITLNEGVNETDIIHTLEYITAQDFTSTDLQLFNNPELPHEMQVPVLLHAMLFKLKANDREVQLAAMYKNMIDEAIKEYTYKYKERYSGTGFLTVGDNEPTVNVAPMGLGFVVVD